MWYPVEWFAWLYCGPQTLPAHRQCVNDKNIFDALIRGTEKNHTGTVEKEEEKIVEATEIGDVEFQQILLQLKYSKSEKAIVSNYIFIVLQFGIFTSYFS